MIQIPAEEYNKIRKQSNKLVEILREVGHEHPAFKLACELCNALIDAEDASIGTD